MVTDRVGGITAVAAGVPVLEVGDVVDALAGSQVLFAKLLPTPDPEEENVVTARRPENDSLIGQHCAPGDENVRAHGRIRSTAGSPTGIPGADRAKAARTHRERTPS